MIDEIFVCPFYEEAHLRRGRTVQRPVVLVLIGDPNVTFDALVDTGGEHVLADSTLCSTSRRTTTRLVAARPATIGAEQFVARSAESPDRQIYITDARCGFQKESDSTTEPPRRFVRAYPDRCSSG